MTVSQHGNEIITEEMNSLKIVCQVDHACPKTISALLCKQDNFENVVNIYLRSRKSILSFKFLFISFFF